MRSRTFRSGLVIKRSSISLLVALARNPFDQAGNVDDDVRCVGRPSLSLRPKASRFSRSRIGPLGLSSSGPFTHGWNIDKAEQAKVAAAILRKLWSRHISADSAISHSQSLCRTGCRTHRGGWLPAVALRSPQGLGLEEPRSRHGLSDEYITSDEFTST